MLSAIERLIHNNMKLFHEISYPYYAKLAELTIIPIFNILILLAENLADLFVFTVRVLAILIYYGSMPTCLFFLLVFFLYYVYRIFFKQLIFKKSD